MTRTFSPCKKRIACITKFSKINHFQYHYHVSENIFYKLKNHILQWYFVTFGFTENDLISQFVLIKMCYFKHFKRYSNNIML